MTSLFDVPGEPWTRAALGDHLRRHPVDATFVGVHDYDHQLPDPSPDGIRGTVDAMRRALAERPPDTEQGSFAGLDRRLTRGFLTTRIWEYESGHVSRNPSVHTGDAIFGLMAPLLTRGGSVEEQSEAVHARLGKIPRFLDSAKAALVDGSPIPAAWTRRAIRECRAGIRFVEEGLNALSTEGLDAQPATGQDQGSPRWAAQVRTRAAEALGAFVDFLQSGVSLGEDVACGEEAFGMYLREGHFLRRSADDIVAYARDEMARTRSWLTSTASDFGASTPDEVTRRLADRHPDVDGYLARYGETWAAMRDLALKRELVTWPDFPIEYVERPRWARAAAPDLYFLFYRSPAALRRPEVHRYMVAPPDPQASDDERDAFLRANNDSVIKLNHVVHHGGIGHHVQNWHASRSPSIVGRVAAVDCASRVAMFCGGTMAEGWACYATDLMAEAGGLTELERYAEHAGRVRMCARAIVDVELHRGAMSLAEAVAFYRQEAGMSAAAAEGEAVKNSMFPGGALMYLVGTDLIHELRRDLMQALGDGFDLRAFHDAFLSYGSIPVRLVADEMRRRAAARLPLGAHDHVAGPPAWMPGHPPG